MKINVIFDSAGNIVGAAWPGYPQDEEVTKAGVREAEAGVAPTPGQSVHEIEVPDELMELEEADLIQKLREADPVKQVLGTIATAGQGEFQFLGQVAEVPAQTIATAGQAY